MLEAVGNSGTGANGVTRAGVAAAPPSAVVTGSSLGVVTAPLSPRMKADPQAGIIIAEYLSSSGALSMQLPSQAVVAYLRSGLSADGSSHRESEAPLETEA